MKHIKHLSFILLLFVLASIINAQNTPPSIQWQKSLGGTSDEAAYSIKQTNDGGYIIAGYGSSSNGDVTVNLGMEDYWIVKIDSTGNIQWQKSFGGSSSDYAKSIQQTIDGGYIVAGRSRSNDNDVTVNKGYYDYWVVKIDTSGNLQWQKSFGGTSDDEAQSIIQTKDGGYIIAGWSSSNDGNVTGNHGGYDYWIVKIDTSGNLQWQKCFGGSVSDQANSILQIKDGSYIIAGYSCSNDSDVTGNNGNADYWIIKIDSIGNIKWQKSIGGTGDDLAQSIQITNDGSYIIAGWSGSNNGSVSGNHGGFDYCILKIDTSGNVQWQKSFGGSNDDYARSIQQTNDGGYVIAGNSVSNDGDVTGQHSLINLGWCDDWVVKIDTSGNLQWQKALGGTGSEAAFSVLQTIDGGYIVAGPSRSNDGDVIGHYGNTLYNDYWIVKLNFTTGIDKHIFTSKISIYPNPSCSNITLLIPNETKYVQILNTLGQVLEKRIVGNQTEMNFKIKNNGIYFVQIVTNNGTVTKKVVISED
jgi:hypothetical protein